MTRIVVLGAGAFGTALAIALAGGSAEIDLLVRDPNEADRIAKSRENRLRLPGAPIPAAVSVTSETFRLAGADAIILAVPMQYLATALEGALPYVGAAPLVAACKGIDLATLRGPTAVISGLRPAGSLAVLTGPSFATDIARGLPTALTLACADRDMGRRLQSLLASPTIRLYCTTDVIGAELGGALKNVVAIAGGACIGSGLGESARAALMTRGFAEMRRLVSHFGAREETLFGLSGMGDLVLTCTSAQSRNFQLGLAMGREEPFDRTVTVEGVLTARAIGRIARRDSLDLPVSTEVARLVEGSYSVSDALKTLLARPLREE